MVPMIFMMITLSKKMNKGTNTTNAGNADKAIATLSAEPALVLR